MNIRPGCETAIGVTIFLTACSVAFAQTVADSPAPVTEHWIRAGSRAKGSATPNADAVEQWPYKFNITGTAPDDSIVH